ncbi:membrane associated rhomboid family serine protease [Nakamurella sp. UYEF19]|uniref:rhomboid family intramembrane serine protease n=1 Tax=Nakamurella sp. UYEF19 TaxID=1756392 RepID=UPI003394C97F
MTTPMPPAGQDPQSGPGQPGYPGPSYPVQPGQYSGQPRQEMCAFHPDRATGLHCTRCGRPACPECLTQASVGFHCRACVAEGQAAQRSVRTVTGAPVGQRPIVTFVLIGLNVLVFLITAIQAKSGVDMTGSVVFRDGSLVPAVVAGGQWWRLLSSGFLHLSVIHIGLNMLSLYFVGVGLERILGRSRFLAVYLLSLLGGAAAVMLLSEQFAPVAGASGAIFGVLGGLAVAFKRFKYDMRQLLFVLALNLFLSFQVSGISWQGHIGGLVVGAVVTAAFVYAPQSRRTQIQVGTVVLVFVLIVLVVIVRDTQLTHYCGIDPAGYFVDCT